MKNFFSVIKVLKEYNKIKEEIKNLKTSLEHAIQKTMKKYFLTSMNNTANEN